MTGVGSPGGGLRSTLRRWWWRVEARARGSWLRLGVRPARRVVFVFDYESTPLDVTTSPARFRELSPEEIGSGRFQVGDAPRGPRDLETGCIIGMIGDQQVYHAWYIRSDSARVRDLPESWRPSGPILFLHDGMTELAFRGRGIHSAATRWLLGREKGGRVKHAVCVVAADNRAAQRAVRRAGFRVVGHTD